MRSSINTQRDRQAKKGSTAFTTVVTATKENPRPAQKPKFCRPKIMVDVAERVSAVRRSSVELLRKRDFLVRAYRFAVSILVNKSCASSSVVRPAFGTADCIGSSVVATK